MARTKYREDGVRIRPYLLNRGRKRMQRSNKEFHKRTRPSDTELHKQIQPSDKELHKRIQPTDRELHASEASSDCAPSTIHLLMDYDELLQAALDLESNVKFLISFIKKKSVSCKISYLKERIKIADSALQVFLFSDEDKNERNAELMIEDQIEIENEEFNDREFHKILQRDDDWAKEDFNDIKRSKTDDELITRDQIKEFRDPELHRILQSYVSSKEDDSNDIKRGELCKKRMVEENLFKVDSFPVAKETQKMTVSLDPRITTLSQTVLQSYRMCEIDDKDVPEIASQRALTVKTISDHLIKAMESGLYVNLKRLSVTKEIFETVANVIKSPPINNDVSKLTSIKQHCPEYIELNHIKVVIAALKIKFGVIEFPASDSTNES